MGEKGSSREVPIRLGPGEGWGTGSHETTQLCLQAIALMEPKTEMWRMLDFGSGSGLLSIAAAKLGAWVDAVETDEAGHAHGESNARLNAVSERIRSLRRLGQAEGPYDLIVANILKPVLLENAEELTRRLAQAGTLILSGLVSTDIPEISVRYSAFLQGASPQIFRRGEWNALIWQSAFTCLRSPGRPG